MQFHCEVQGDSEPLKRWSTSGAEVDTGAKTSELALTPPTQMFIKVLHVMGKEGMGESMSKKLKTNHPSLISK